MIESKPKVSNPDYQLRGTKSRRPRFEEASRMTMIRQPVLSGTWYPADPIELAATVDDFLSGADPAALPAGRPLLAVVPHAGFVYSGPTAGKLFGLLPSGHVRRIIMLAPNHRIALNRVALCDSAAFATPLGTIEVDQAAVHRLAGSAAFEINPNAHAEEHAIEIQLPFLQRVWPEDPPRIVPLLVPSLSKEQRREAAIALQQLADEDTLFLVSTDFTHYGANYGFAPFGDEPAAALEELDAGAILKILAADPDGLRTYGQSTGITMCGLEATALALDQGLPPGYEGALLHYCRSGDRDGDYSLSVSYASVLLCTGDGNGISDPKENHEG
jgi:AmmeMemoRadiSam system protein B